MNHEDIATLMHGKNILLKICSQYNFLIIFENHNNREKEIA